MPPKRFDDSDYDYNHYNYDEHHPPVECAEERVADGKVVRTNIPTNRNCRIYHVRFKLYGDERQGVCKWEEGQIAPYLYYACSTMEFIAEKIPSGITDMFSPNKYEIWITKGEAFNWDELEPTIFAILNSMTP